MIQLLKNQLSSDSYGLSSEVGDSLIEKWRGAAGESLFSLKRTWHRLGLYSGISTVVVEKWWYGLVLQTQDLDTWSHRVDHELPRIPKISRVRCEAICLTAKVRLKLCHVTRQLSQNSAAKQNGWKRSKLLQWSSQSRDLNATEIVLRDLNREVHIYLPTNLNELK